MAEPLAHFRPATKRDCYELAHLFRMAAGGVADYMWSRLVPRYPGLTPLEIGAHRFAREERNLSYTNCVVVERDGVVIGMLFAFPIEEEQEADGEPKDPILEPYGELKVPGSFYVGALALHPAFRGRGLGTELLSLARERARERGFGSLSLLVFEWNKGAVALYERNGFEVVDRAPVVAHELIHYTGDVLLMVSEI